MSNRYLIGLGLIGIVLGVGGAFFTVEQTEQAIVLQFGEAKRTHRNPGLKFKLPFIQEVIFYEKRALDYDLPPIPVIAADQKRLVIDAYTRYKIANPIKFFQAIKPATETGARLRLEAIISSVIRNVLGKFPLRHILYEEREKIMKEIDQEVRRLTEALGIELVDVRIIRTELPPENRAAVFARMNSDLIKIAKENRAKGEEGALKIRSTAEKEKTIIIAEARKEAQSIKGEGEAKAIQLAAKSLGKDPEFYTFIRSLEVYSSALKEETNLILSTDNSLLRFFSNPVKNVKD